MYITENCMMQDRWDHREIPELLAIPDIQVLLVLPVLLDRPDESVHPENQDHQDRVIQGHLDFQDHLDHLELRDVLVQWVHLVQKVMQLILIINIDINYYNVSKRPEQSSTENVE